MIYLLRDLSDDAAFIDLAEQAINGTAAIVASHLMHVVKIDSWFGDRWYSFSGKLLGIAGVRSHKLTVPPFHPHRVVSEVRFRTGDPAGEVAVVNPLHTERTSQSNLRNFVERLGESITIAWYSGDTKSTGQGSIMIYSSAADGVSGWYAGLTRTDGWRIAKFVGIERAEWDALYKNQSSGAKMTAAAEMLP